MCPYCRRSDDTLKRGFYTRRTGRTRRVQRYYCRACQRFFSAQTGTLTYRERKPHLDQVVFLWLASGVSQRRLARNLGIHPVTVARKLVRLGRHAAIDQQRELDSVAPSECLVFDEMETFEHTKCKPLSIAVAVDEASRRVIAAQVAVMPAKGKLAAISRRRYGTRKDGRKRAIRAVLGTLRRIAADRAVVKSDACPRYPGLVRQVLPQAVHCTYKGRRGCVVGQGELKRGGWDPLFSLNHSCAMFRDNLKRLTRRSWCTTKRADRLQALVNVYIRHHNLTIAGVKRPRVIGKRS